MVKLSILFVGSIEGSVEGLINMWRSTIKKNSSLLVMHGAPDLSDPMGMGSIREEKMDEIRAVPSFHFKGKYPKG